MLFPRPVDGISVNVTPPGWRGYRLKAHRHTMSKLIKKVSAQSIKNGGPRSGPSARSGTRIKELYLGCNSLDEMSMEPHAGANNAYYSRKCARASLPNIDDLLAGVPPGTCPVCSIQEPIYRPQPLAPHENAPGKRACALQTKPSTQPPRTQPITKHRMLNRGASSTANTSAIFADISTGN